MYFVTCLLNLETSCRKTYLNNGDQEHVVKILTMTLYYSVQLEGWHRRLSHVSRTDHPRAWGLEAHWWCCVVIVPCFLGSEISCGYIYISGDYLFKGEVYLYLCMMEDRRDAFDHVVRSRGPAGRCVTSTGLTINSKWVQTWNEAPYVSLRRPSNPTLKSKIDHVYPSKSVGRRCPMSTSAPSRTLSLVVAGTSARYTRRRQKRKCRSAVNARKFNIATRIANESEWSYSMSHVWVVTHKFPCDVWCLEARRP